MAKKNLFMSIIKTRITNFEFMMVALISLVNSMLFIVFLPKEIKQIPQDFDYYPQCMPCKRIGSQHIYSSLDDYVFVFAYERSPDYQTLFQELRSAGYIGKIVAFTKSEQIIANNSECGVEVVLTSKINKPGTKEEHLSVTDAFRKYYDVNRYISKPNFYANRIGIFNASRVFFLKDPFSLFPDPNKFYMMRTPVSLLPFGSIKGDCSELWTDREFFYDNAFLAGGEVHVRRFLKVWLNSNNVKRCLHTENDKIILSNYGETGDFGGDFVHVQAIYFSPYDVIHDPDSLIAKVNLEDDNIDPGQVPIAVVDWKKSMKFQSAIEKRCNIEIQ